MTRFSQYGKLAPKSKADFVVTHVASPVVGGAMAVAFLRHGVLFRGGAEGHPRVFD